LHKQRHELRDPRGGLIAVLDVIEPIQPPPDAGMIELAADVAGSSYRVRIYPVASRRTLAAA
jgi:hypothetical protein